MLDPVLSTNIKILILDYNEFGNEGIYQLMNKCKYNKTLTYLSLNYCGIEETGIKYFQDYLTSPTATLESLHLQGNPLKNSGVSELIQILFNNIALEEINLNNVMFGNDIEIVQNLVGLIQSNTNLIIYHLKFNFLNDKGKFSI
jgi:Ran GTPase-activating protein (RanGAP) involved in mRNA processing and transport